MTNGPRQRGSAAASSGDAVAESGKESGGGVALKKEIGLVSACGIIVGNIIGSGIFVSPKGVMENASSVGLALIVWIVTGIITAIGALCYAELGVTIPKFLRLWIAVLVIYPTNQAVIALTFSNYVLQPLFPTCFPPENGLRLLAGVCLLLLTWVNCSSVRWATRVQDIFTAGKLLALALIIIMGIVQICKGEYYWLEPAHAFEPFQENLPRAIFISIPLVTFVYVFANIAYVTAMSPQELLASNAVAVTFGEKLLGVMSWIMPISVALSTFGGVNGSLFTSSRLCCASRNLTCTDQSGLAWPVIYLLFWAFLLIFSLYSEPVVCGLGMAIMLTGVPVYFLAKMTYLGQKFCVVVYPGETKGAEEAGSREECEELKESRAQKSADC
ncbi:unnamed protein product [Coregonus sp. 'balchen']|nr:unnamed protein product [Coregonus sp. 'balchen']